LIELHYCSLLLYSLQQVRNELVKKLSHAALMTSALESQIKRYTHTYTHSAVCLFCCSVSSVIIESHVNSLIIKFGL